MSTLLSEHTQYVDDAGVPIAGGKLYIGLKGGDPVGTAPGVAIYGDRELTTQIANPQDLGTDGRSLNKIWVDGEYSIQVNSLNGLVETQEFQDLDAGEGAADAQVLEVVNILGSNAITGTTSAALSTLNGNQQFIFTTVGENTGPVTLDIDDTGARPVVKNHTKDVLPAEFEEKQVVLVVYNDAIESYEWVNQNNKVIDFYVGTNVAAAATTDIWVSDGNTVNVTGTTGITSFGTAPNVGASRTVIFKDSVTVTHSANLALPGGVDYTTKPDDVFTVQAVTATQFFVVIHKVDGTSVVQFANNVSQATTSGANVDFTGIPPTVTQFQIFLDEVSSVDLTEFTITLGDAGGFETTGYDGRRGQIYSSSAQVFTFTNAVEVTKGFIEPLSGRAIFTLVDPSSNRWHVEFVGFVSARMSSTYGFKELSAALTRVRLSHTTGNFDGGSATLIY